MSLYGDIEKNLGTFHLSMKFQSGDEPIALLGASGCGKSLTLKCIAGIETPDKGRIVVDDVVLFDSEKKINLTPQQRRTGLMFQNYALFPNMTVLQNIRAGASREKDRQKRAQTVEAVMESFGLTELADRLPHQLSGGQQQRVALARILVSDPKILLLDEPFSALDSHLRFRLEREVRKVLQDFGKSVVLVSHDRDEVFRMSDRVAIVENGSVTAAGTNREVFTAPITRGGASLTGCKFISSVEAVGPNKVRALDWGLELEIPGAADGITAVGVRMHDIRLGPGENHFHCRVVEEIENPFSYTLMLRPVDCPEGNPFGWTVNRETWNQNKSQEVEIHIPKDVILLLRD